MRYFKVLFISYFLISISSILFATPINEVQIMLNKLGYNPGPADGAYGEKTKKALEEFYSANSSVYDGKLDANEIYDLRKAIKIARSNNLPLGFCSTQIETTNIKSEKYSDKFELSAHIQVITSIPNFRSFSYGSTSANIGGPIHPEIKAVGDINNDGKDDLILDYYETSVPPIILLGTESGKFTKLDFSDSNAARRHIRNGELADINSDGFLDFVGFTTGAPGKNWIGEGHTTNGKSIPKGEADILLINQNGTSFKHIKIPEIRKNDWNHGGTTADINNDGLIDIIPLSEGESQRTAPVINYDGTNFSISQHQYSKEISRYLTGDVDSADFNNDGYADLAFILNNPRLRTPSGNNKLGTIRILYGDGDFDFRNNDIVKFGTIWLSDEDGKIIVDNFDGSMNFGAGHDMSKIATGSSNIEAIDLDSDGFIDILEGQYFTVSGSWSGSGFKFYRNTGECFYDATNEFFPNQKTNRNFDKNRFTNYIHNFYFSDINNDGLNDIVLQTDNVSEDWKQVSSNIGYPYIFINHNNQKFLPVNYKINDVYRLMGLDDIVSGDFNGDGFTDILGIYSNSYNAEIRAFYKSRKTSQASIKKGKKKNILSSNALTDIFIRSSVYKIARNKKFSNQPGAVKYWVGFLSKDHGLDQKMPIYVDITSGGNIKLKERTTMLGHSIGDIIGYVSNKTIYLNFNGLRCDTCEHSNITLNGNLTDNYLFSPSENHEHTYILIQQ